MHVRVSAASNPVKTTFRLAFILMGLALSAVAPHYASAQFGEGIVPPFENAYTENITDGTQAFSTIELLVSNILGLMTALGSILFIVYFLLGAIGWITAGGDSGKIGKARDQMLQGVMGLIVLVGLYAIVGVISSIVGIDILNPAQMLEGLVPN